VRTIEIGVGASFCAVPGLWCRSHWCAQRTLRGKTPPPRRTPATPAKSPAGRMWRLPPLP